MPAWFAIGAALLDVLVTLALGPASPARILTKPLPALILAFSAMRATSSGTRWLGAGLILSAIGDETLLHDGDLSFIIAMACFAAMHACYITAFVRMSGIGVLGRGANATATTLTVFYLALYAAVAATLVPHAGTFAIPILAYAAFLIVMAKAALGISRLTMAGGFTFVCSDLLLAYAKFYPGFPLDPHVTTVLVDATYFAAQIMIATGVQTHAAKSTRETIAS